MKMISKTLIPMLLISGAIIVLILSFATPAPPYKYFKILLPPTDGAVISEESKKEFVVLYRKGIDEEFHLLKVNSNTGASIKDVLIKSTFENPSFIWFSNLQQFGKDYIFILKEMKWGTYRVHFGIVDRFFNVKLILLKEYTANSSADQTIEKVTYNPSKEVHAVLVYFKPLGLISEFTFFEINSKEKEVVGEKDLPTFNSPTIAGETSGMNECGIKSFIYNPFSNIYEIIRAGEINSSKFLDIFTFDPIIDDELQWSGDISCNDINGSGVTSNFIYNASTDIYAFIAQEKFSHDKTWLIKFTPNGVIESIDDVPIVYNTINLVYNPKTDNHAVLYDKLTNDKNQICFYDLSVKSEWVISEVTLGSKKYIDNHGLGIDVINYCYGALIKTGELGQAGVMQYLIYSIRSKKN